MKLKIPNATLKLGGSYGSWIEQFFGYVLSEVLARG